MGREQQAFLFEPEPEPPRRWPDPPHNGRETSRAAANQIKGVTGEQRRRVLEYVRGRGTEGATRDEIEAAIGIAGNACRPRCIELLEAGYLRETEQTRLTRSGRKAVVLVATGPGMER